MKLNTFFKTSLLLCGILMISLKYSYGIGGAKHIPTSQFAVQTQTIQTNKTTYSQAYAERDSNERPRYGLGLSTVNVMPFINFPGFTSNSSFTGMISLTSIDWVQAFVSIPQTSPFNFGVMGLYKRVIMRSQYAGLHFGGGVGFANVNAGIEADFGLSLSAIGGIHFRIPNLPQIEAHLDGGATFYTVNHSVSSINNFQVTALSPALGLSVLYLF